MRFNRILTPVWLDSVVMFVYVEYVGINKPFEIMEVDGPACLIRYGNLWSNK